MTRGHGWSLTITMRGTLTPYSLPAFTGAFDLTPILFTPNIGAVGHEPRSGEVIQQAIGYAVTLW